MEDKLYERATVIDEADDDLPITIAGAITYQRIALPFQIGYSGTNEDFTLSSVRLEMKKDVADITGNLIVEIRSYSGSVGGTVGDEVYGREEIDIKDLLTTSYQWIDLGGIGNPTLRAGNQYCIVLKQLVEADSYYVHVTDGGEGYYPFPTLKSENDGITFSLLQDFGGIEYENGVAVLFAIYGGVWTNSIIDYNELVNLAGAGASSDAKKISICTIFADNAEGYVDAATKYDWGTNWATQNEKAKKLVKASMLYLAAIDVINYDYSGYGTRFEAREIAETLRQRFDYALELLRDDPIKTYIQGG